MPEMLPKITVVTPSYNQGIYIEDTILSVIGQGYDNLEYIIMDGGSTDNTVEVIKQYEKHITYWQSKKDDGQSAAINEGFAMATGDILYWLCSDDMLIPGTLLKIGRAFKSIKEPAIVFGNCLNFYQTNFKKVRGSNVRQWRQTLQISLFNYMYQPSSFWNRAAWEKTGKLRNELYYAMDWDWFIRADQAGVNFVPIDDYLSLFRWHDGHKTSVTGKNNKRDIELAGILSTYNNEKVGRAFLKLKRVTTRSRFAHNIVYASNHFNITPISRLIHLLFFSSITYKQYSQISNM